MAASPTAWPPVGRHGGSIRSQGPHNPGQERDGLKTQSIHLDAHKGLLLGPAAGACCWGLLLGASGPRRTGSATVGYWAPTEVLRDGGYQLFRQRRL